MSEGIKPALSAEAWGRALQEETPDPAYTEDVEPGNLELREAALRLHRSGEGGTPWFTWGDVDVLRSLADDANTVNSGWVESIADCIAALLPPRNP